MNYGVAKEQANYLKKSKCEGDYCNFNFNEYYDHKFGYLRDSIKILAIEKERKKDL